MLTKNEQYIVSSGYKAEQARRKKARGDVGPSNRRIDEEGKMWTKGLEPAYKIETQAFSLESLP